MKREEISYWLYTNFSRVRCDSQKPQKSSAVLFPVCINSLLCLQLVRRLRGELDQSHEKLRELLAVNEMLDSHCRALEYTKRDLELQLEAAADSSSDAEQNTHKVLISSAILFQCIRILVMKSHIGNVNVAQRFVNFNFI